MSKKFTVVVTGATGKQGGALVKSLLERGHDVRAVSRATNSAKAKELARASLEDTAALTKALEGATSLFAMTTPFEEGRKPRRGKASAPRTRPKPRGCTLSSPQPAPPIDRTGIPHFDSKYEVEEHIAKIGVRATVLAPGKPLFRQRVAREWHLRLAALADVAACAGCRRGHRGRRRSPPRGPWPLRRQALRSRGRRALGK